MDDVNPTADAASVADATPAATVETDTTQPQSQEVNKTAGGQPEAQKPIERTIPYSRFSEVNKGYKELQRKLAEYEQKSKLSQYSEDDMGQVMNHPFVQDLLVKQATYELKEFVKDALDGQPEIPENVKKAILSNPRGFVKETTTDVESAKIDIQEYIDSLVEQLSAQLPPKKFPVAATKVQETSSTANPVEVQQILEKPVDEWTEDEAKLVTQYKKSMPKR